MEHSLYPMRRRTSRGQRNFITREPRQTLPKARRKPLISAGIWRTKARQSRSWHFFAAALRRPINEISQDALIVMCGASRGAGDVCQGRASMPVGTVKFFNTIKGYGFIQPDDGSKDVFVHISAVERAGMTSLREGQKISFDITTERGKTAATNIKPA
jgi:CspA family cold shock protein